MELEDQNRNLAFLDVLVTRKETTLGHTVYRKPTHTDRYLHNTSNHHPCQRKGIIKTLVDRARRICEPEQLATELEHLKRALMANGYTKNDIDRYIKQRPEHNNDNVSRRQESETKAFLPFIPRVTDRIGRILGKHNIKTIFKPSKKIKDHLNSPKDRRDTLSTPGVYRIPCSCGSVYIGTTKRSINTRIKEHKANCRLGHSEKSAVAEHTLNNTNHAIEFDKTQVLCTTTAYYPRLYREAIEIHKHPTNFNKSEESLKINRTWVPVLKNTKPLPYNNNRVHEVNEDREPVVNRSDTGARSLSGRDRSSAATPPDRGYIRKYNLRPRHTQAVQSSENIS